MPFSNINDLLKKDDAEKPAAGSSISETGQKFSQKMVDIRRNQLEAEAERRARKLNVPFISLEHFPVSHEALRQIPREIAAEKKIICFFATQDEVRLGAIDPLNKDAIDLLAEISDRNHADGRLYLISEDSLTRVLDLYNRLPTIQAITKDIEIKEESLAAIQSDVTDFSSFQELLKKKTTTDTVIAILGAALKLDASDVHIENEAERIVVRFRLDGVLHDAAVLPKDFSKQLLSRIKLTSALKINITDEPQDGRFTIKLKVYDVDVRVSTIPTVHGESVVMRLLRQTGQTITLDDLGFRGHALQVLKTEITRPNGMIIITGPTGSGKSTTLYAILTMLNKPGVKIITLEDPVEYRIAGVNQSQIDHTKDYTFGKALRSILRQDPDIVMVGEIRDLETADIAVQAALTGHLLLSTIHTNSAAGAIARFMAMGVKPFLLTPSLNCVLGQRLVRRLCDKCKKKVNISDVEESLREKIKTLLSHIPESEFAGRERNAVYESVGCPACNNLGYKGRISLCEIFSLSDEMKKLVASGAVAEAAIEEAAKAEGMITMAEDGILKALEGITSPQEVFRVTE